MHSDLDLGLFIARMAGYRPMLQDSEHDVAYQEGNFAAFETDIPCSVNEATSAELQQQRWDLNYHEAAIYLQEGENNDKFSAHPKSQDALPAYLITHNRWFYMIDLAAAFMLMLLALIEAPSVPPLYVPIAVHASLELLGLLIMGLELGMRMKWLGPRTFLKHIRTMIKTVTLVIMFSEAIAVMIRQSSHLRVTRALRPLFLIDSYHARGVRRFVRQMIQSLPAIIDMLVLVLFFMLIFSILGFYLFCNVPHDTYFQSIQQSFISLFILLTTANYPDVMLPAYNWSRWSAVFFITYLSLELYFLLNLLQAVVLDVFTRIEKEKLKKLLLHKRQAAEHCFQLLVGRQNPTTVSLKHFQGLLKYLCPKRGRLEVYLLFKTLNTSQTGCLSQEEFYGIYEVSLLKWKRKRSSHPWASGFCFPFNKVFQAVHKLVSNKWFDYVVYAVIVANFVYILAQTIAQSVMQSPSSNSTTVVVNSPGYGTITFASLYVVETVLKLTGFGPLEYFSSGWNMFDFVVIVSSMAGLLLQLLHASFYYIIILRPFRLLRLFKLKRRYRDVFGTLFILFSRMISIAIVILLLFYSFAIIGMEVFSKYDMKNCCVNTSVEAHYYYNNNTGHGGYYYLNSFENVLISGVTLFVLMVVNNWYIIMEGYAHTTSDWSRIYFMLFYIVILVVLTIVVAFILDAFLFRMQYRQKMHVENIEDHAIARVDVFLSTAEMEMCQNKSTALAVSHMIQSQNSGFSGAEAESDGTASGGVWFRAEKVRSKDDYSLKMYQEEVKEWIEEVESERHQQSAALRELQTLPEDVTFRHRGIMAEPEGRSRVT